MPQIIRKENGEGIIYSIKKNRILVAIQSDCSSSQQGCKGGCVSCAHRDSVRKKSFTVTCPESFKVGQSVSFTHHVLNENLISLTVFGTPVLLSLVTIFVWYGLAPEMVESAAAMMSAAMAFCCGFFVIKVVDAFFRKKYPAVLSKASGEQK
ncbi:MAG: SoxR reducing system RseC family protein [Chitinispirillaceae bacterium]